jgi:hypothetical protein
MRRKRSLVAEIERSDGKPAWPFFIRRSTGRLDTALQNLVNVPGFTSEESRRRILDRIKALPANWRKRLGCRGSRDGNGTDFSRP